MSGKDESPMIPIPAVGDVARQAGTEGDVIDEVYGVRIVPRSQFRPAESRRLCAVTGIGPRPTEEPKPDLATRMAADYLPPKLRAQLIAEGRLTAYGTLVPNPPRPRETESCAAGNTNPTEPAREWLARLGLFFRKLF